MPNIRLDLQAPPVEGQSLTFKSPADCSQVTGLIVYYPEGNSVSSKTFQFADAHGNNVGNVSLFAPNVLVKVILHMEFNRAYVQNADTNAYLEGMFATKAPLLNCGVYKKSLDAIGTDLQMNSVVWIEAGLSGSPFPNSWGIVETVGSHNTTVIQRATNLSGQVWVRTHYTHSQEKGEIWTEWQRVDSLDSQNSITGAISTLLTSNLNANIVPISNSEGKIVSSDVKKSELDFLKGVTSNIQTQLDDKFAYKGAYSGNIDTLGLEGVYWVAKAQCTGTFPGTDWNSYSFLITNNRYQRIVGFTDNGVGTIYERYYTNNKWYPWIRTDPAGKQDAITGLTPSMVMICNANGQVTTSSSISTAELAYLDGVTSNIQTQLDARFKTRGTLKSSGTYKDLNDVVEMGSYWVQCSGMTNTPFSSASGKYGILEVIVPSSTATASNVLQRFTQYGSTGIVAVYERDNVQNGWKDWKRIDGIAKQDYYRIAVSGAISAKTVRDAIVSNKLGSYCSFIASISSTNTTPSEGFAVGSIAMIGNGNSHASFLFMHYGSNILYKCVLQGDDYLYIQEW